MDYRKTWAGVAQHTLIKPLVQLPNAMTQSHAAESSFEYQWT